MKNKNDIGRVVGLFFRMILISAVFVSISEAGSIEAAARWSLYSDVKAYEVGDAVMVIITESASASGVSGTETSKEQELEASGEKGTGFMKFFSPFNAKLGGKNEYKGSGSTSRSGRVAGKMTVKVTDVLPNGNLLVEGSRTIEVNNDKEVMILSGVIRPADITNQNTINSYQIANIKIVYKGKGTASEAARQGLFMRLVNFIF